MDFAESLSHLGFCKELRAKQNAERLHGHLNWRHEQSTPAIQGVSTNMYSSSANGSGRSPSKNGGSAPSSRKKGSGLTLQTKALPTAKAVRVIPRPPQVQNTGRSTMITGHEQIATVSGSVSFAATKYGTNPGLTQFAWLSSRAAGFEKYRYRRFVVHYIPDKAVTTTPGSVFLAADFDPSDAAPGSLADMSTYEIQSNDRAFEAFTLNIPISRMFDGVRTKKIRSGPVPGDLTIFDGASFSVCTVNCSDTSAIGQLWVDYEVELISPQVESTPITNKVIRYTKAADQTYTTTVGAVWLVDTHTTGCSSFGSLSSGRVTLPAGFYRFRASICASDSAAETLNISLSIRKDASIVETSYSATAVPANGARMQVVEVVASSTGSNVFDVWAVLTGAAGTLKAEFENNSYFEIEAI